ncbi:MAG: hypothetical protein DRJ31_02160, partial [Candidatus Methanomethylicota archaeon]
LKLEEQLYKHLIEATKLYLTVKSVLKKIMRREEADPLKILESWRKLAEETLAMLSSNSFKAHIVTIPEWLSIVQTERLVKELTAFKVNIGKLIVNQVALDDQARKAMHQKYLSMLKEKLGFLEIIAIPVQRYELRGLNNLLKFSMCLADVIPF